MNIITSLALSGCKVKPEAMEQTVEELKTSLLDLFKNKKIGKLSLY